MADEETYLFTEVLDDPGPEPGPGELPGPPDPEDYDESGLPVDPEMLEGWDEE
jgi:hypothetical protein